MSTTADPPGSAADVAHEAPEARHESEARYRAVIDSLRDGLIVQTRDSVLTANRSAARILGVPREQLLDVRFVRNLQMYYADRTPVPHDERPSVRALTDGTPSYDVTLGTMTPAGWRWFLTNTVPLFHQGEDAPYAVALSFTDITKRKEAEDALRESEMRFRTLADSLPVGVFHADVDGHVDYTNPRLREIIDVEPGGLEDPAIVAAIHPDDRAELGRSLRRSYTQDQPYHVQFRTLDPDGSIRWLSGRGARMVDPDTGEATGLVGSIEDITPLTAAQEQNARLAAIVESTSDVVGIIDWSSGRMVYLNRAARELFGYVDRDLADLHFPALLTEEGVELVVNSLMPTVRRGEIWSGELPMRAADGSTLLVWQTSGADRARDGRIIQVFSVGRDVTERRRFEQDLAWQATHDSHTGLPNRALLLDHLGMGLARAARDNGMVALLFLDLDRFKQVNDTLGHDAGDELLAEAAGRISGVLRPTDTVARLGGDEFVVLAEDVEDEDHAIAIGQRVAASIDGVPFMLGAGVVHMTASIGIAVSRSSEAHPETLLRDADAAMYRAKDRGRARLEFFDESMRQRATLRNQLADQLAAGIERGDIEVYYQPCVDLVTGHVTGVEALARWAHPERGILSPYEFIGLAEETGLIVGLGLVVLSKACHQAFEWHERFGAEAPRVHVNLSARQLTATNLPALVAGVLDGTGLPPDQLCLEITESVLMDDAAAVIDTLWALKAIGVSLAIDDFGTGYSSLSYLRRFPVDVLKVDRSFIDGLGPDPEDSAIVAAIVNLAASLELDAVAEGVETRQQLERLVGLGCHSAQGFLFSEPRPPAEIETHFGPAAYLL